MATKTITKNIEVKSCDICGLESEHISTCRVCGLDMCNSCKAWNMCTNCWNTNHCFATVEVHTTTDYGYESRTHTSVSLKHDSPNKWYVLMDRFAGKRIKISIEEVLSDEEMLAERRKKQMSGDGPTNWLERCG